MKNTTTTFGVEDRFVIGFDSSSSVKCSTCYNYAGEDESGIIQRGIDNMYKQEVWCDQADCTRGVDQSGESPMYYLRILTHSFSDSGTKNCLMEFVSSNPIEFVPEYSEQGTLEKLKIIEVNELSD